MAPEELPQDLIDRRDGIVHALGMLGEMQSGSLVARYRKCGKPTCHCATDGGPGHGPSWSLTRRVDGRTVTRVIAPGEVAQVRARLAEHRRMRRLVGELVEVSDKLWESRRGSGEASRGPAAKKGASRRPSRRRRRPRRTV